MMESFILQTRSWKSMQKTIYTSKLDYTFPPACCFSFSTDLQFHRPGFLEVSVVHAYLCSILRLHLPGLLVKSLMTCNHTLKAWFELIYENDHFPLYFQPWKNGLHQELRWVLSSNGKALAQPLLTEPVFLDGSAMLADTELVQLPQCLVRCLVQRRYSRVLPGLSLLPCSRPHHPHW